MKNKKLFAILTLVCFMMTLMPVAAFAADSGTSEVYTVKDNPTVTLNEADEATADITYTLKDAASTTESGIVYVWFTEAGSNVASSAVKAVTGADKVPVVAGGNKMNNVFATTAANYTGTLTVTFQRSGEFTLHAATADEFIAASALTGKTQAEQFAAMTQIKTVSTNNKVTVKDSDISSSKYFLTNVEGLADKTAHANQVDYGTAQNPAKVFTADSVAKDTLKFQLKDGNDAKAAAVKGATVKIETDSANLVVSAESTQTNALGQFSFDVAASLEGNYKIYLTVGGYTTTIYVKVGATGPAYIKTVKEPENPIDREPVDANNTLSNIVRFMITDINGNLVDPTTIDNVGDTYAQKAFLDPSLDANKPYVSIVSQPSASTLTNGNVYVAADTKKPNQYATLKFNAPLTAEGTYVFKVALDNGSYATATVEIKEFQTPVSIELVYAAPSVELGGVLDIDKLNYVDANGVRKACAKYVDLAATGYAVQSFGVAGPNPPTNMTSTSPIAGRIVAKADEKYVGSNITVTAVDDRYDLITTVELTVADDAKELSFGTKTAEVNVNNTIPVFVVDGQGNRVALGANGENDISYDINYVVLDKPEGAKVSVATSTIDNNLVSAGSFKMILTSNKIGNVTVQAIAKVTNRDTTNADNQAVTKYYTGTQIFAVGNGSVGDVVVMSVGSNEIVINDAKATIDAAPIVKNDRTFVPFRALAEAFGAEVAYDEATQAVTAELNGVKVVMTIGSATYTVNGAEKTMDVAPFINGSRTMVPVRFVAEAFGIKVIPTYDENGATADILFNL